MYLTFTLAVYVNAGLCAVNGVSSCGPAHNGQCLPSINTKPVKLIHTAVLTHWDRDTPKCIFLNNNFRISIEISLKFVPAKGLINNTAVLVQIMAWRQPGDKPLSKSTLVILPTYICVTWPQWVNVHSTRYCQWLLNDSCAAHMPGYWSRRTSKKT